MKFLCIYPESDYEILGEGINDAIESLNSRIIEANSAVEAVLLRHCETTDISKIISNYEFRFLNRLEQTIVIPLPDNSKAVTLSSDSFTVLKKAFIEKDSERERQKDLAELARLQEKLARKLL